MQKGDYRIVQQIDIRNIKLNVATLCSYMGMTTEQLAEAAKIDKNRLAAIRAGRVRISGDDLLGLSEATGIPVANIQTSKELQ